MELAAAHPDFAKTYAALARTHSLAALLFVLETDDPADYARLKQDPRIAQAAQALKGAPPEAATAAMVATLGR